MRLSILLIIIILMVGYVLAIDITLPNEVITANNVIFKCIATDAINEGIIELELWHNITGNFELNQTNASAVSSGVEFSFDTLNSIQDGRYEWNCFAKNASSSSYSASSNKTFTISIIAPTLLSIGNITTDEDIPISIILSENISDNLNADAELTFTSTNSNEAIASVIIDNSTNNISFFPILNKNGEAKINLTVYDTSFNQASDEFTLIINPVNDAPYNKTEYIENLTWFKNKDKVIDLTTYFDDVDNIELNYTATQINNINISIDNSTGRATLTPETDWVGLAIVNFTAYDENSSFTSNEVTLTVKEPPKLNTAPKIDSFSPSFRNVDLNIGNETIFSITKSDLDNDNLTVDWFVNNKSVASNVDIFTYIANELGTFNIEVKISDGALIDANEWIVRVKEEVKIEETIQTTEPINLCGNNRVDEKETCSICPQDVKCKEGESCINDRCVIEKKSNLTYILILLSIILIIIVVVLFYFYKKRQRAEEFQVIKKESEKTVAPATEIEDFYKEPKMPIIRPKPKKVQRSVNIILMRNFIKDSLQRGHSKEKVKRDLLNTGWNETDIDEALKEF